MITQSKKNQKLTLVELKNELTVIEPKRSSNILGGTGGGQQNEEEEEPEEQLPTP
ncbi:MAG: hypothetical protein AAFX87_18575 [Bacteroidota bacterium]